jgi:hypothetical protein
VFLLLALSIGKSRRVFQSGRGVGGISSNGTRELRLFSFEVLSVETSGKQCWHAFARNTINI